MAPEPGLRELCLQIVDTLFDNSAVFGTPIPAGELPDLPGVAGLPEFVLESEAGLIFGEPPAQSLSLALPLPSGLDTGSFCWSFGPDLRELARSGRPANFLQVVLAEPAEPISRLTFSSIQSLRSLVGQIPGYLAHTLGNETSGRIHRGLLHEGFSPRHLARAHIRQARTRGFRGGLLVVAGFPDRSALDLFSGHAKLLDEIVRDLALAARQQDTTVESGCEGRTCGECNDREVCDKVREVLARYNKEKGDSK